MNPPFLSQSTSRHFVASALASSVALSGMAVPVAQAEEASTPVLEAGAFAWPIKASFLKHVQGPIAKGTVIGDGGAEFKGNQFVFPINIHKTSLDPQGNGTIALDGSAHVTAYKGLGKNGGPALDVSYFDLKLNVTGQAVSLIGDYSLSGNTANDPTQLDKRGDDEVIVTFTLEAPIDPGKDRVAQSRPTTAGIGLQRSLLRYNEGEQLEGADVDLLLDYDDGKQIEDVTPQELQGSASGFSGSSSGSSKNSSLGIAAGVIAAIVAVIGVGALAFGPVDWRGVLKNFGITA